MICGMGAPVLVGGPHPNLGTRKGGPVTGPPLRSARCHLVRVNTATVRAGTVNVPVAFA